MKARIIARLISFWEVRDVEGSGIHRRRLLAESFAAPLRKSKSQLGGLLRRTVWRSGTPSYLLLRLPTLPKRQAYPRREGNLQEEAGVPSRTGAPAKI